MTLTAVVPEQLSPLFKPNSWDPRTGDPCFSETTTFVEHHGVKHRVVHPASSRPKWLCALWDGGQKILGRVSPIMNYRLNDSDVPNDASFIIA